MREKIRNWYKVNKTKLSIVFGVISSAGIGLVLKDLLGKGNEECNCGIIRVDTNGQIRMVIARTDIFGNDHDIASVLLTPEDAMRGAERLIEAVNHNFKELVDMKDNWSVL